MVSTAVHDVVTLHGGQIQVAGDAQDFISMCRAALQEDGAQRVLRIGSMRAALTKASWDRTVQGMKALMDVAAQHEPASGQSEQRARALNA